MSPEKQDRHSLAHAHSHIHLSMKRTFGHNVNERYFQTAYVY